MQELISDHIYKEIIYINEKMYYIDLENNIVNKKGLLIIDPIHKGPINIENYVVIDKTIYDIESIFEYISYMYIKEKKIAIIPHTKQLFTIETLEIINNKLNKSKIINEIIKILKFNIATQKYLLSINDEQRKNILNLEDYKIEILIKFTSDKINFLFNNYNYLLNKNNSEETIIKAVEQDHTSLLLVQEDDLTDKIIKIAIQKFYYAIKYISVNRMTEHIIETAVKKSGYALAYIPPNKITYNNLKIAVQNCGMAIKYADVNMLSEDIIYLAIQNNSLALNFIPQHLKTKKIIELVSTNKIKHLKTKKITELVSKSNNTNIYKVITNSNYNTNTDINIYTNTDINIYTNTDTYAYIYSNKRRKKNDK